MTKLYTGVDIGDHALKLAVSDGTTIKTMVLELLPDGMVAEGRIVSFDAMADFIRAATAKHKRLDKNVAFVVPMASCVTRRMSVPFMNEKELTLNLPFEFRDYITQGKEKYAYDYAVLSLDHDETGKPESMNLLAVACPKETLRDYTEMFKRAGFRLRVALPPLAALQNLMTKSLKAPGGEARGEASQGGAPQGEGAATQAVAAVAAQAVTAALGSENPAHCCVIDFSHRATQIHFFADGIYDVTRTIDLGGIDITRAIAEHFGIDEHMADEYKLSNFNDAQHIEGARQVYESIAVDASRALNFFGFNNPNFTLKAAYYYGGSSLIPALLDAVAAQIDLPLVSIECLMPPYQASPHLRAFTALAFGATMAG